jgi:outer membrane receptor protein involved in Fe transport
MKEQRFDFFSARCSKSNLLQAFLRFAWCGLLFLFTTHATIAQTSTGGISITVSDPTGALVAGATIIIKGSDTGNTVRKLETSGQGMAVAPLLPPGTYDVTVTAKGFEQSIQRQISVNVGETTDLRTQLATGNLQQTVTVVGGTPLIEDKDSTVAQVIPSQQMLTVPLNGRSYLTVANLSPGVVPTVGAKDSSFSAYGNSGLQNAFLLDGARNVNYIRGLDNSQRDMVRPPLDALEEFSVDTSNYSAEYGNSAGSVVNAITKSGTNEVHGSGWEFLQNSDMNGSNYFTPPGQKPLLVQNQYGVSAGGPIKKNRAWIFGAYERTDNHSDAVSESAVPSMANRQGIFGSIPVYNPFTTTETAGVYSRTQFSSGGVLNSIPSSYFSSITSQLLNAYPAPNVSGSSTLYEAFAPNVSTVNNGVVRVDVQRSSKDSMFVRGSVDWQSLLAAGALPLPTNTPVLRTIKSDGIGYGYTRALSATAVNEVRFAWTGIDLKSDATQPLDNIVPGSLGAGVDSSIPQFSISGYAEIGAQAGCCTNSPLHKTDGVWDFSDNFSKLVHRHSLKAGGELLLIRPSTESASNGRGVFGFTGVFSENPQSRASTGSAVADFLLGTANTATTGTIVNTQEREWYVGGYLQDDWTLSSSLTLNLGVRYEYISPSIETGNKQANFIDTPGAPNIGSFILAGNPAYPRSLVTTSTLDFAPRVGFAYRTPYVKNMVVRGAFGIFYAQDDGLGLNGRLTSNPPFASYGGLSIVSDQENPLSGFEVVQGSTITTPPPISPSQFVLNPSSTTGLQSWWNHMTTPYVEEWNLAIEKQLPGKIVWETTYVGNRGVHMVMNLQGNQPLTNGPGSPTTRRPLATYTEASINLTTPENYSMYSGMSTKLEKKMSSGVSFLTSIAYGRELDIQDPSSELCLGGYGCGGGDAPQNVYNIRAQWGPSDNNTPVRYSLGGEWVLPFGHGEAYLNSGWQSFVAGGWSLAAIYQLESGLPFTPVLGSDNANAGNTSWPNRICSGKLSHPSVSEWFDTSCFVTPPQYQFGDSGRNVLTTGRVDNLDMSVHREFPMPFRPETRLQFRAEAFNVLNHPQFAEPGNTVGSPTFGVVTATSQANRVLQLGARAIF